ncbi:hypothetical protein CBW53_02910 [Yersinia frederiksenii]|nr:hypothetical protein CBW53_02910 [Yersinia frederiksenii]
MGENTKSEALILNFEGDSGSKFNFLRLTYKGKEGQDVKHGIAMINAIMGISGIKNLSCTETRLTNQQTGELDVIFQCPELINKRIGFVLQKTLTTKTDGSDSYRFEIRQTYVAAGPNAGKTFKEAFEKSPAETVDKLLATLKDKDERVSSNNHTTNNNKSMLRNGADMQNTVRTSRLQQANAPQHIEMEDDGIPF